ncbi:MAG: 4Fe-4S binding protein [Candidatus Cloacimonetes bacterium]|nr:4Fe-4S binding protein [Candidatus Cloacimonadota bacterium]
MFRLLLYLRRFSQLFFILLLVISPLIQIIRTFRQDPYPYLNSPLIQNNYIVQKLLVYDQYIMGVIGEFFTQVSGGPYSVRFYNIHFSEPFTSFVYTLQNLFNFNYWSYTMAFSLITPIILALIAGRIYCSYICPMSFIVNLNLRIRKYLKIEKLLVKKDKNRKAYFGVMLLILILNPLLIQYVLPPAMLQHAMSDYVLFGGFGLWLVIIVMVLGYEILNPTSFCKNWCPTGLFLSYLGEFRRVFITYKEKHLCEKGCDLCNENCWLGLSPKSVAKDPSCDLCMRCTSICPTNRLTAKILLLAIILVPQSYANIWDQERDFSEVEHEIVLIENQIPIKKSNLSDEFYYCLTGTYRSGKKKSLAWLIFHRSSELGLYTKAIKVEIYQGKKLIKSKEMKTVNTPESVRKSSAYRVEFELTPHTKYKVKLTFVEDKQNIEFSFQYPRSRR